MILAETSVVVALWRSPAPRLLQIIPNEKAVVCGVTIAEIYQGARTPAQFARCAAVLGVFGHLTIPDAIWLPLGHNLHTLRTNGITVPFTDALLATIAIEAGIALWTYDNHFLLVQTALPALQLFQEPP